MTEDFFEIIWKCSLISLRQHENILIWRSWKSLFEIQRRNMRWNYAFESKFSKHFNISVIMLELSWDKNENFWDRIPIPTGSACGQNNWNFIWLYILNSNNSKALGSFFEEGPKIKRFNAVRKLYIDRKFLGENSQLRQL